MFFTAHNEVARSRDMTTNFGGYNHKLSCQDGEFFDMQNMTTAYYPMLSPRNKRGICKEFTNPQALIDKDGLAWIDDGVLHVGEDAVELHLTEENTQVQVVKMGANLVFFPMGRNYNTETKESKFIPSAYVWNLLENVTMASQNGEAIEWYWESALAYKEPANGDYCMFEEGGKRVLKQWSESQGMWIKFSSTYVQITAASDMIEDLEGCEVKMIVNNSENAYDAIIELFPDDEGDGYRSATKVIQKLIMNPNYNGEEGVQKYTGFIMEGVIDESTGVIPASFRIEPLNPTFTHPVECNNRIWAGSEDGHEIYASKLGEWDKWKSYQGVATDSYAATIGSDGKFTGAVTYQGNPIFFKENTMIKVTVSSTGAHQIKEVSCPGVQNGSEKSLCVINGVLYYKGVEGIYAYDGSLPVLISSSLGEVRYYNAVSGTILDRYYVSMKDGAGKAHLFVYDTSTGMWAKEDNTDAMMFCKSGDELYYIDNADKKLKSIRGTLPFEDGAEEDDIDWYAESGNIGFSMPDKKHLAKLQIRLSMELGTNVCIYLQYDSSGNWEHVCNLSGTGTRSFIVPIIPRRCDHFKYMVAGRGGCKIFSVTKTIEEGSEL